MSQNCHITEISSKLCEVVIMQILYPQKLALTSPTTGGRSVGIVRSRTKAMELIPIMQTWK
jgi:hypothetical protein